MILDHINMTKPQHHVEQKTSKFIYYSICNVYGITTILHRDDVFYCISENYSLFTITFN